MLTSKVSLVNQVWMWVVGGKLSQWFYRNKTWKSSSHRSWMQNYLKIKEKSFSYKTFQIRNKHEPESTMEKQRGFFFSLKIIKMTHSHYWLFNLKLGHCIFLCKQRRIMCSMAPSAWVCVRAHGVCHNNPMTLNLIMRGHIQVQVKY